MEIIVPGIAVRSGLCDGDGGGTLSDVLVVDVQVHAENTE